MHVHALSHSVHTLAHAPCCWQCSAILNLQADPRFPEPTSWLNFRSLSPLSPCLMTGSSCSSLIGHQPLDFAAGLLRSWEQEAANWPSRIGLGNTVHIEDEGGGTASAVPGWSQAVHPLFQGWAEQWLPILLGGYSYDSLST